MLDHTQWCVENTQLPILWDKYINHKLDTDKVVLFYENDFYPLSNFSSFRLKWQNYDFDTSEHAYHWEKFDVSFESFLHENIQSEIKNARSAHEAFKIAERNKAFRLECWGDIKVGIMKDILRAKVSQHEYVYKKLLDTGDRLLVEDSWRDSFWGWGPDKTGQNMLGKLWMEIRAELRK
jgi:ribA/ribD-fused uncharacterized protein